MIRWRAREARMTTMTMIREDEHEFYARPENQEP